LKVDNQRITPTRKLLWEVLQPNERRSLVGIVGLILLGTVLETFSIGIMIPVLSLVASADNEIIVPFLDIDASMDKSKLIQIAVCLMFGLFILKNSFLAFSTWIQRGFLSKVISRIASKILENYIRQPFSFHLRQNSSKLIRNTQDASMIVAAGVEPMLTIFTEVLIASALFVVLLLVEPIGTLCVVGSLVGASFVFQRIFDRRLQNWGSVRQVYKASIIRTIQQGLGAVKDIKVLDREDWFIQQHQENQELDADLLRRINTVQAIPRLWLEVMAIGGIAGLVVVMLATGKEPENIIPTVGLFAFTAFRLLPSVNRITSSRQTLKISRSTIETIHQDLKLSSPSNKENRKSKFVFDAIETKDLSFRYELTKTDVLLGVNVSVRKGEAVGFVGQSGSGKSTLIDLLLGLLDPRSGSIFLNNRDINDVNQQWQRIVGYIPQTIFLMDDSLRRNIAIGIADNEIDEVAIVEALKSAQLEEFVASLPEGLDTVVGERGVRLSGGQRQRIGIARALYHRPSVLVLDEATSSLDTETEHGVMQAVQALQGDKTVIIVAHRLSTVEYCDRLYRLDAGRIVDEGTFDEVMNRSQS
jgi:ABC-type multidrug transport system fused ATPase/permease subunit